MKTKKITGSFEDDVNKIINETSYEVQIAASTDGQIALKDIDRLMDDAARLSVKRIYDKYGDDLLLYGWAFASQEEAVENLARQLKSKMAKSIVEGVKETLGRINNVQGSPEKKS